MTCITIRSENLGTEIRSCEGSSFSGETKFRNWSEYGSAGSFRAIHIYAPGGITLAVPRNGSIEICAAEVEA